jgi:hypothetical protein
LFKNLQKSLDNLVLDKESQVLQNDEDMNFIVQENICVANVDEAIMESTSIVRRVECENLGQMLNYTRLIDLKVALEKSMQESDFDNRQLHCRTQLLDLLNRNNAPLHLFDDIMKWTYNAAIVHKYDFTMQPCYRDRMIRLVIEQSCLSTMLPKVIQFELPNAKQNVKVTIHNIEALLFSLLPDKDLMQPENLIFANNPLEKPIEIKNVQEIFDVYHGYCYINAYHHYCTDNARDVLCPLVLFIDKTHTDVKGNLTLEPVCMTLGIFNHMTRSKEFAWRTIGFVPSLDKVSNRSLT